MAGELLLFGIQRLWNLLSQEYELFQGVEDQVSGLKRDLNLLSSFLKDANAKKHTSAVVKNCVEEIKEIICDGEDIIETFLLKQKLGKKSGVKKSIRRLACIIPDRRENALNIGGICIRISNVIQNMQSFGVQQIIKDDGYMQLLRDRQREMRQTFPMDYESNFVGLEANVKKLVGYFVEKENVQIVSITGMGGLGKTTLARQVFNHKDVKRKFDGLAWICVSQDFTRMNVWQKIFGDLKPKEEEKKILEMTESTLQRELIQLLETSKSLIVLDDIWKEEDWELIKPVFSSKEGAGWKVLLTSRNESVVMRRDTTFINFKPECLNPDDSWALFQRIALPRNDASGKHSRKDSWALFRRIAIPSWALFRRIAIPRNDASESKVDEEMEEMGKQIIKHCGGLPLAVRVLGGLLAEKYTLHDWKRVSENIGSHLVERTSSNNGSIDHVLSMSIEELPSYLKHCFLYLAHFPEDHKINIEDLSYCWAAEGISKHMHYDGETIRDIGDSYIEELVRRNMVISERDVTTLRYETCHLHDMMRDVCLLKAKEENFLQIAGTRASTANFQSHGTSRRFVSHDPTTLHVERDISNPKLRSLVVVWGDRWKLSGSSFKRLELLRVLDLCYANFRGGKLPSGIGKLIHLRYLSLRKTNVSHLPASLGNLLLLIYLNLDIHIFNYTFVPNVLMGMKELRYLALPDDMNKKTKLELSNLVKLETLKNFSTKNSSIEDLRGMVRLRTLTMKLDKERSIETLSALIGGLGHLEDLNIKDRRSKRNLEEGIVWDFSHLKRLRLIMFMPKLPKEQHFPSHLTTLLLVDCRLEEDPMPILEKLLQLKEVSLMSRSFSGKKMVCSGGGFPRLQELELSGLDEWEEWIVEEGSMPLLHTLNISRCKKLKELPDGLRFITSLKELHIFIDKDQLEFKEKLSRGEDFYKVQHIPHLKIE